MNLIRVKKGILFMVLLLCVACGGGSGGHKSASNIETGIIGGGKFKIEGVVKDLNGNPISGVWVNRPSEGVEVDDGRLGDNFSDDLSDDQGRFSFYAPKPTQNFLIFAVFENIKSQMDVIVNSNQESLLELVIILNSSGQFELEGSEQNSTLNQSDSQKLICRYDFECGANEYCLFPNSGCLNSGLDGVCESRGNGNCPAVYEPVCSCDDRTIFTNKCLANADGVAVSNSQLCFRTVDPTANPQDLDLPQCESDNDCKEGFACYFDDLAGSKGRRYCAEGSSAPISGTNCPAVHAPVCVVEGFTYFNSCLAYNEGATIVKNDVCY